MLFFLTGDIQTGKTRWLEALVEELARGGVESCGVLAPGQWVEHETPSGEPEYEKLGIDNVLLPQGERICFAYRSDLVPTRVLTDASQAQEAQLRWIIQDSALERVNAPWGGMQAIGPNNEGRTAVLRAGELEG